MIKHASLMMAAGLLMSDTAFANPQIELDGQLTVPMIQAGVTHGTEVTVRYLNGYDPDGKNVVIVHGMAHDGDVSVPLSEYLTDSFDVNRVYVVDLPAHGTSEYPGIYGETSLDNYVDALDSVLQATYDGHEVALIGHSLGGITIQSLQADLIAQDSSIDDLGVTDVVLFASTLPDGLLWRGLANPDIYATLLAAMKLDSNGCYFKMQTNDDWTDAFFTDRNTGELYDGAVPTDDEASYMNNGEPCTAAFNMLGLDADMKRPIVPRGAFKNINYVHVGFSADQYVLTDDNARLYGYLTGNRGRCYNADGRQHGCTIIPGSHDGFWSVPVDSSANDALYPVFSQIF